MAAIITGDIHLTSNPQDEYRWKLFDWLRDQSKGVNELILLGDHTTAKDNHPASLVNRFKNEIERCAYHFNTVILLAGNHDYIDPKCPFFMFLEGIGRSNVFFIHKPSYMDLSIGKSVFVPAGTDWSLIDPTSVITRIFAHATFDGAISETGYQLTGVSLEHAERIGLPIISGDIHKRQCIGKYVEYVGAPYHTRFGDQYEPRILKIENDGTRTDLHYPAPLKRVYDINSLEDFDKLPIDNNQHAKIRVHLERGYLNHWPIIRDEINDTVKEAGWSNVRAELVLKPEAAGPDRTTSDRKSPEQLVEDYSNRYNAGDVYKEVGNLLLRGRKDERS